LGLKDLIVVVVVKNLLTADFDRAQWQWQNQWVPRLARRLFREAPLCLA
jgi:hypothetical protein